AYHGTVRHLRPVDAQLRERRTAVFIVCDRVESYLGYVKQRRPELLGRPPARNSVSALTGDEVRAAQVIEVADAQKWIAAERPLVIDLRSSFAYAALHIDGSVNIVDELFDEVVRGGLPFGRRQPVLLACPVGEQSARYAALLTRMGHPDVRSLAGGIIAWRDAGAPLVRD
ncbi:pyridoxal-5'-phosphate-dependent protein subunit beta, partial [Streptomyces sp. SID7760]|nr:pyridoxal-5'-phosphate-dependent protein subunit beta [Streptomyces sp. SID7760]